MSAIDKIAYNLGARDEVPNQELAKSLVDLNDTEGMDEIASYLYDKNKSVASDCLKVIYEAGYLKPEMTSKYVSEFLKLLTSKNNRMVWGAMIAVSNVTPFEHEKIFEKIDLIMKLTKTGTVITHIHGINVMLKLCVIDRKYYDKLYPTLLNYLRDCRPVDFGKRVELYTSIINDENREEILTIVKNRLPDTNKNQQTRIKKALKDVDIII